MLAIKFRPDLNIKRAPPCYQNGQTYIVQEGDWLSKIAQKYYTNTADYQQIVTATNEKAKSDKSFKIINNGNNLTVGQKIWIPSASSVADKNAGESRQGIDIKTPVTDCEIRIWYNYQVVAINKITSIYIITGINKSPKPFNKK